MQFLHSPLARLADGGRRGRRDPRAAGAAQQTNRISITTGGTGGVYYPMGGGMANILSKYVPGLSATAEVTGGSVDNLKLINAGKSEVGLLDGRRRLGCVPGHRQVQGRQGQRADADGALSQQDARRDHRGHGHQQAVRSQGQARVDRLRRQRHGDHGVSRARGCRHRRQEGHQAGAPRRRRVGQRDQGPQDRRVLLGRAACPPRPSPIWPRRPASR